MNDFPMICSLCEYLNVHNSLALVVEGNRQLPDYLFIRKPRNRAGLSIHTSYPHVTRWQAISRNPPSRNLTPSDPSACSSIVWEG